MVWWIVFGLVSVIVIYCVFSLADARRHRESVNCDVATGVKSDQTGALDQLIEAFMEGQEDTAWGGHRPKVLSPRAKQLLLHFRLGALDRVSRMLGGQAGEAYFHIRSGIQAGIVYYPEPGEQVEQCVDLGWRERNRYGQSDDEQLFDAGKKGYLAIQAICANASGESVSDRALGEAATALMFLLVDYAPDAVDVQRVRELVEAAAT